MPRTPDRKAAAPRMRAKAPRSFAATTPFERGTGYCPELLALRAVLELRQFLRASELDRITPTIIELVAARAECCWLAQPLWRARWSRANHSAPLMVFFRHWTAAAARRAGILLPDAVLSGYALGERLT